VIRPLCLAVAAGITVAAYEPVLSPLAVTDAIVVGQSRVEAQRIRLHQPYRIAVNRAPVDAVEIVTPFRRLVLAAEARVRNGAAALTQREGLALLAEADGRLELVVELTFHPLNTYLTVPDYFVKLAEGPAHVQPVSLQRVAIFGPRLERFLSAPPPPPSTPSATVLGQPMSGATILARFDPRLLNVNGNYDVVISEGEREIARAGMSLGKLR
jgi:hypothetical protein